MSYPGIQISKHFSALLTRVDIGNIGTVFFFAGQKNNIKWRRRRKILRVRCKNLAFYTTEPLKRTLFCGAKNEKWRRRQKKSRNSHFPKALPWFKKKRHGSTRRGKNAGKKIESALIWGRHLQKGLVKSVGFFFPSRFLCFFFFFFFFFFGVVQLSPRLDYFFFHIKLDRARGVRLLCT